MRADTTSDPTFVGTKTHIFLAILIGTAIFEFVLPAEYGGVPSGLLLPIAAWFDQLLNFIANGVHIFGVTIQQITRACAVVLDIPIKALTTVFVDGIQKGYGFNKVQIAPPMSWLGVSVAVIWVARRVGGIQLLLLALVTVLYILFLGLYQATMTTLASVMGSIVLATVAGLFIGVASARHAGVYTVVRAVMNLTQTVPIFSYLLPTLMFLGYGPSAAVFATFVYALPPMVHATVLALQSVEPEIVEYASMAGCTKQQNLWRVQIPAALPKLGIGLNQVVMMSFNMAILTSMIGVGGLGYLVLQALRRLDIGAGLEAGMGIVLLGILLDRITQATSNRQSGSQPPFNRKDWLLIGAALIVTTLASYLLPALATWPKQLVFTSASIWNDMVSWINVHLFDALDGIRTFLILDVFYPYRDFLLGRSFLGIVVFSVLGSALIGGPRLGLLVAALLVLIGSTGFWTQAVLSFYLVSMSVAIAILAGVPIGVFVARNDWARHGTLFVLDTLQTLPTLIYLLPAVMLFRNGDVSAIFAIVSYSIAPAIRYVMEGLHQVPSQRIEAGKMSGCNSWQLFRHIEVPSAFPTLLLGLNQTVMMALSMLIIAAMVGTKDLGQEVFMSLTRSEVGKGIAVGICVAALALISDALLKTASSKQSA
ncbi:ABC transporter permease subunit (plasmid) [Rhizobium sp. CB3090]|uniref:ABC transporter permease n=1 Tax=Rhizobium sp. CB3090 TaxID=3039156 RepID=UPI0024B05D6B|nr:ABC transporter permease subunit [Rhizobium sp. CB3090]WFU11761.1 ABC transporter permease subunit [Rhizobium sp. CB3090]